MKPRIGLSMNYHLSEEGAERAYLDKEYFEYVDHLGALPFPICPTDNIVALNAILGHLDGVIFTGGLDLDAALWDERTHKKAQLVHPRRQRFDLMLYDQVQKQKLPILALCLGMQVINVAHGGSLHQHLPDLKRKLSIDHGGLGKMTEHPIVLEYGSSLFGWLQTEQILVNSGHHQAINCLGDGLTCSARAGDGIIEAFERADYPFLLAIQWHPEKDLNHPVYHAIMEKFLDASMAHAKAGAT